MRGHCAFPVLVALVLLLAGSASGAGGGVKDLHVVALFRDSVVLMVDGKRRLLRTGDTSPEGISLLSAGSDEAVFEFEGRTLTRRLDGRSGSVGGSSAQAAEEMQIFRDTGACTAPWAASTACRSVFWWIPAPASLP